MSSPLVEWGEFAARNLSPPPTRRTGKRWIIEGEIEGDIIGGKPYVDEAAFLARRRRREREVSPAVRALLYG